MSGSAQTYALVTSQIVPGLDFIQRDSDLAMIPLDLDNADYQQFLTWIAAGNPAPSGWTGPKNP